jgi:beta-phosphoglucomutase-like phosphatase (HAD superfamily)
VAGIEAIRAAGMFSVGIGARITTADWCLPDTGSLSYDELARRFREAGKT